MKNPCPPMPPRGQKCEMWYKDDLLDARFFANDSPSPVEDRDDFVVVWQDRKGEELPLVPFTVANATSVVENLAERWGH